MQCGSTVLSECDLGYRWLPDVLLPPMPQACTNHSSSSQVIMYLTFTALCLSVTSNALLSSSLQDCDPAAPPSIKNANHIFNAIYSSMRQWGSSLNHNGMSFFLAHIPAGTELYHGGGDNVPVDGMEWLAFEPEHAMNFAWKFIVEPRPPKDGKPTPEEHDHNKRRLSRRGDLDPADHTALRRQQLLGIDHTQDNKDKKPPDRPPRDDFEMLPGWLHTYKTSHALRVLYLDGEAAAKSGKGTLDSQDYLLAPGAGRTGDYGRARQMCSLASDEWEGRIDGFIRMEHGFELMLCDFRKSVELVRMERVSFGVEDEGLFLFSFLKAIGARYHGIGGKRVSVSYEDFVTVFAEDVELFGGDDDELPRLNKITQPQRESIMAAVKDLVLKDSPSKPTPTTNWQSVTDMIVTRYSDALHSLAFDPIPSTKHLQQSLTLLLRPFIDYDARDVEKEMRRCAKHFIPDPENQSESASSLARATVVHISTRICDTLFTALSSSSSSLQTTQIQSQIRNLTTYLRWTTWKECRPGCQYDELCFTAIWPFGDKRSHEAPYCVNVTEVAGAVGRPGAGESYWDGERR